MFLGNHSDTSMIVEIAYVGIVPFDIERNSNYEVHISTHQAQ